MVSIRHALPYSTTHFDTIIGEVCSVNTSAGGVEGLSALVRRVPRLDASDLLTGPKLLATLSLYEQPGWYWQSCVKGSPEAEF